MKKFTISRDQPLFLRVKDDVLGELPGSEACAYALQEVVVECEQRAVLAEAGVRANAECEEQGAELRVGEDGEVAVVVEGEVFDEEGGHEA